MKRAGPVRTRLAPEERRRRLLEVGADILAKLPFGAVSTQEVARRAGVSPGLLYHYFPDKRRFHLEILRELARRLSTAAAWPEGVGPREALRASLGARLDLAAAGPGRLRALLGAGPASDREVGAVLEALREEEALRVARGFGLTASAPRAALLLRGWVGFCEAAVLAWLERGEPARDELRALLESALEPVLRALAADAPGAAALERVRRPKPRVRLVPVTRPAPSP